MSLVLDIQKQLHRATERVVLLERALRENPDLPSITGNLESAVRLQDKLTAQFHEAAAKAGYDIFSYRAFDEREQPNAAASFKAVADFQTLFSVVHSALKMGGRKLKAVYNEEVARETTFGFGYAMAGSIEVVLTVQNEQMLFEANLDQTVNTVFALVQAQTPAEIEEKAVWLGPGPINALFEWTKDNVEHGLGAELKWKNRGGGGVTASRTVVVQRQEISQLKRAIHDTSADTVVPVTMVGKLVAVDLKAHRFKMERHGMVDVAGTFEPGIIDEAHKARLPQYYEVDLNKIVHTRFATGDQKIRHHLLRLREVPQPESEDE